MSVYDGKTVDEMFDAVDLPDWADTNGSVEGWYKEHGADFIQSPIIPGETTFAEAVDALGIRDVITAMGIQGDAFKDASLDFESQFSEETKVSVSWREDGGSVNVYWTDKDGRWFLFMPII